jgi:succinyl-diaminopimelate desuccinylase
MAIDLIKLTQDLIRCNSITPNSNGSLELITDVLKRLGFETEVVTFDNKNGSYKVSNLIARYGSRTPILGFCGHLDVVESGNAKQWKHPPFSGNIDEDYIYGRGAVDMKSGITSFITAVEELIAIDFSGSIVIMLTLDEENESINGIKEVMPYIKEKGIILNDCLVGECTSSNMLGDTVKIGRRGSLNFKIIAKGTQGHVAYKDKFKNPIPFLVDFITDISSEQLDFGNEDFSASQVEITSIKTSTNSSNVVPSEATAHCNIRFNNFHTISSLKDFFNNVILKHPKISLEFAENNAESFISNKDSYIAKSIKSAIEKTLNLTPEFTTTGGTSDARFIKNYTNVVEFGMLGKGMHEVDEKVSIKDLINLNKTYLEFLKIYFKVK